MTATSNGRCLAVGCVLVALGIMPTTSDGQRVAGKRQRTRSDAHQDAAVARPIDAFFRRANEIGQFNGVVLVADSGRVVYERAFGQANMEWHVPNDTTTRFEIASMTKSMTAILVMQLVEEGRVRLDGHVSDYLSFYPRESGSKITVDQLLSHTSGLQQDIAFADDPAQPPWVVFVVNADVLPNDSLVALIAQRPLRFEPGTSYSYSSDGYAILGAIIEHVTGMSYWDALRRRVLDRVGMRETGVSVLPPLVPRRASGYVQTFDGFENAPHIGVSPAGGLFSTLRDLYAFDRALYGDQLVGAASRARLFATRSVITAYGWKTSEEMRPGGSHRQILRATGGLPGFAALLFRVPSANRVIILLANTRDLEWRFDDFALAVNHILDREPFAMPRRSAAEELAKAVHDGVTPAGLRQRFDAMRADTVNVLVTEASMNRLGYYLLYQKRRVPDAVAVFRANVSAFPSSANVYDSLGEALLVQGDTTAAMTSYQRSLELDRNNSNAATVLKRLRP